MKPTMRFEGEGRSYVVKEISYEESTLVIQDEEISDHSPSDFCNFLYNFTVPPSPIYPLYLKSPNYTFVNCQRHHQPLFNDSYKGVYNYRGCEDRIIYYWSEDLQLLHDLSLLQLHHCSVTHFPLFLYPVDPEVPNLFSLLDLGFGLLWNRTQECIECQKEKGFCTRIPSTGDFDCFRTPPWVFQTRPAQPPRSNPAAPNSAKPEVHLGEKPSKKKKILIAVGAVIGGFLLTSLILILYFRYCKKRYPSLSFNVLSRAISSFPNCNSEIGSSIQTQFFSYKELEEATNNFDPSKELGDGGFGTVYHGKLWDGRFVAIKRLYQNNHRRVEQFKNEVNILSRLRHQNLVMLYGCSSRHSRELLLVYEFIPNRTVAYHLHGDGAKTNKLTWSTRMCIAIETADALAYLHQVEIIHRDVKTDNILLDNNFCVKVADFGLSRLFPFDVTHVSTVPQGTPGYVDPDYHRCYQLTDRSDVYSFGVVLIELVSSLPAVDISRHRHEINLANMAINKIQNDALHELVEPTLGFDSDFSVRRMITSVAELAFRCLQDEKEVRPSMEEVLEELRGISGEKYNAEKMEEAGTPMDDIC
ncbi:LEAF RUST 10 DISEASE-RESISTANCE LOCUS RECEPTOR-LIKE PROTEIN KINASE-like 1.1 [Magnolia sinica]|uniref:LEAF RUST 10 DISEASE-RESISTANCE LOCUS RECEPTOR-LIKE PROTEIN KINASE-like 1.1 n=1 Tax=Magnolia sinica TaxID=86752 RepID=UPI00265B19AE|nr:LEAF RUST 10 DISEASE-RESISTANCE LOCUS RECEPTOR-LIKE PROTEIN KINASE-like 1.1 [Magnolia sinica]